MTESSKTSTGPIQTPAGKPSQFTAQPGGTQTPPADKHQPPMPPAPHKSEPPMPKQTSAATVATRPTTAPRSAPTDASTKSEPMKKSSPEELVALLDVDAPTTLTRFTFGRPSLAKLEGVHPDLRALASLALKKYTKVDFGVVDGLRSAADQLAAYNSGASRIKSGGRHQTGHAIDVIAIDPATRKRTYNTATHLYDRIHEAFKAASEELGIPFRWGGTFSFGDFGHFELPKAIYSGE